MLLVCVVGPCDFTIESSLCQIIYDSKNIGVVFFGSELSRSDRQAYTYVPTEADRQTDRQMIEVDCLASPVDFSTSTLRRSEGARPTLSQFWCFKICLSTFQNYIKFAELLIVRLQTRERAGREQQYALDCLVGWVRK